jgi:hypothetical protein
MIQNTFSLSLTKQCIRINVFPVAEMLCVLHQGCSHHFIVAEVVKNCPIPKYNMPCMFYITPVVGFLELHYDVTLTFGDTPHRMLKILQHFGKCFSCHLHI